MPIHMFVRVRNTFVNRCLCLDPCLTSWQNVNALHCHLQSPTQALSSADSTIFIIKQSPAQALPSSSFAICDAQPILRVHLFHISSHKHSHRLVLGFLRPGSQHEVLPISKVRSLILVYRVGQNRIYAPYMTVYLVTSLPNMAYIHRIYMVLANPTCIPLPLCTTIQKVYHLPGGSSKHNFLTARVKSIKKCIFEILLSRALDWCMYGSNRRGGGEVGCLRGVRVFWTPLQKYSATPTNFKYTSGLFS